jgi:hypothetical protein
MPTKKTATAALLALPSCPVEKSGGALTIHLRVTGLLAAGGLFEVVPVSGPVPPVLEERWEMTVGNSGLDHHVLKTAAKELFGDAVRYRINLCALSQQFQDGVLTVTVEQDGLNRPINPPQTFDLKKVVPCESPLGKVVPTSVVGGFRFDVI